MPHRPSPAVRAVVFDRYGPPEVLRVTRAPLGPPGDEDITVRVRAAGVNPVDVKIRRGDFATPGPFGPPRRLGNEFSGTVTAVGAGVSRFRPGDHVLGSADACAYASAIVVPERLVVAKPERLGWLAAGSLPAVGQTAWVALEQLALRRGEVLLIHAAAGGVGSIATQLAIARGAHVIGTASPANHEYLRALGATPVAHGPGLHRRLAAAAPRGIDAALDLIGRGAVEVSSRFVGEPARIGTTVDLAAVERGRAIRVGGRSRPALDAVAQLAGRGALRWPIAAFPLDAVRRAHRLVEAGHVRGKVALELAP